MDSPSLAASSIAVADKPRPPTRTERWLGIAFIIVIFTICAAITKVLNQFQLMVDEAQPEIVPVLARVVLGWGNIQTGVPWVVISSMILTLWLYQKWICYERSRISLMYAVVLIFTGVFVGLTVFGLSGIRYDGGDKIGLPSQVTVPSMND